MQNKIQKITPFLWFDNQAEEAANFYASIFKNSKVVTVTRVPKAAEEISGKRRGTVMTVRFLLDGQEFVALNGGPLHFKFTEAISFVVNCETQNEIDEFWEKLSSGGQEIACGWLKDKYGLSWQVVPSGLGDLLRDNGEKSERVMAALLKMKKLDLAELEKAYAGQ